MPRTRRSTPCRHRTIATRWRDSPITRSTVHRNWYFLWHPADLPNRASVRVTLRYRQRSGRSARANANAGCDKRIHLLVKVGDMGFLVETMSLLALIKPLGVHSPRAQGLAHPLALDRRHSCILAANDQHHPGFQVIDMVDR